MHNDGYIIHQEMNGKNNNKKKNGIKKIGIIKINIMNGIKNIGIISIRITTGIKMNITNGAIIRKNHMKKSGFHNDFHKTIPSTT